MLRTRPTDTHAAARLALVEAELASLCTSQSEARAHLLASLARLEALQEASLDNPRLLLLLAKVLAPSHAKPALTAPRRWLRGGCGVAA